MQENAHDYFMNAVKKFRANEIKAGLADLETAIRLDPNNPTYFMTRGLLRYDLHKFELALSDFSKAIEFGKELKAVADAYRKRLSCHFFISDNPKTIHDANWLIEHNFADGRVYALRAKAKNELGHHLSAIEDYSIALQTLTECDLYFDRAKSYYKLRQYHRSLTDLDIVFTLKINEALLSLLPFIYKYRAFVHYRLGNHEKSFADYNQVQQLLHYKPFDHLGSYLEAMRGVELYLDDPDSFQFNT